MILCFTCKEYVNIGKFVHDKFQGPYSEAEDAFKGMIVVVAWLLNHIEHRLRFSNEYIRPGFYLGEIPGWQEWKPA